jgi:hypothetical protein
MASSVRSFRVEDRREKPFFTVDNRLVTEVLGKVSSDTVVLYLLLVHHEEEGGDQQSYDEIANRMGVPVKTVVRCVSELTRIGLLQRDGGGCSIGFPEVYHG